MVLSGIRICYQKIKVYNASNETIQHPRTRSRAAYFFCFREEAPENFARSVSKQSSEIKKGIAFIHDLLHLKRFEVDHQRELPVLLRKLPWWSNWPASQEKKYILRIGSVFSNIIVNEVIFYSSLLERLLHNYFFTK